VLPAPREEVAPLFFRIGAANFTPGGFADFIGAVRSTNVGSGTGTAFGSIPFSNTAAGKLSEARFGAQNSRLSMLVTSTPGKTQLSGYVEVDFLGTQPGNAYVSSNSNTLRLRLYWANVKRGNWEILGGQSWSLLTPSRAGISPLPAAVFFSQAIDTNYVVGIPWTRTPQVRVVYHVSPHWTLAGSLENADQFTGSAVVLPAGFAGTQVDNGTSASTPALRPDSILKVAWDSTYGGRTIHLEAAGLSRSFRVVDPTGVRNFTAAGSGGSFNLNVEVKKNVRLIGNSFFSSGGGRYLFGLGPDLIVRPDYSIAPVKAAAFQLGFEAEVRKGWLTYGYYGVDYFGRSLATSGPSMVGYGGPGSGTAANRAIQEPTIGLTRVFWKRPEYGALQTGVQLAYVQRNPWWIPAGNPAAAHSYVVLTDFRYVLP
jgi:hypothetical protein